MPKWIRDLEQYVLDHILVGDSGCWPWTGGTDKNGYGRVKYKGKWYLAHRLVCSIFECVSVEELGPDVRHTCDNPICVRPSHLIEGTQAENHDDMLKKGRNRSGGALTKGEENGNSLLTDSDAMLIFARVHAGERGIDLAAEFQVSPSTISGIKLKKWRTHIHGE